MLFRRERQFGSGCLRGHSLRTGQAGIVHAPLGKSSFAAEKLRDNFYALLDLVMKLKPATAKGVYLKGIALSTTMGPGVKIDPTEVNARHR